MAQLTKKEEKLIKKYNMKPHGNSWKVTLSLGFDPVTGNRIQKKRSAPTPIELENKILPLLIQYNTGDIKEKAGTFSFEYVVQSFNATRSKKCTAGKLSRNTLKGDSSKINRYIRPYFENVTDINKLFLVDIEKFADYLNTISTIGDKTRNYIYTLLGQIFNEADKIGAMDHNPMKHFERPKMPKTPVKTVIYPDDVFKLLQFIDEEASFENLLGATWIAVTYSTGFRHSEINGVEKQHIQEVSINGKEYIQIEIVNALHWEKGGWYTAPPKTPAAERKNILPEFASIYVKKLLAKSPKEFQWLFQKNVDTPPYNKKMFNNFLSTNATKAGLPYITAHNLRHSNARTLLANSQDHSAIKTRLGHAKIEITNNMYGGATAKDDAILADLINDLVTENK